MQEWQRKRSPDEVPTPLAVAVSDFCRRAQAPSGAAEVREALALVSEEEDFRVRGVTDAEPPTTPLGPFAVIDLLRGVSPPLAAQRQACGYYEVARALAAERQRVASTPVSLAQPSPPRAPVFADPAKQASRPSRASPPSMSERIAPKKRAPPQAAPIEEEEIVFPFAKRDLPQPKGRFTRLPASKQSAEELFKPEAAEYLTSLVDQHGQRVAILRTLTDQYTGRAGSLFGEGDLEQVIAHHRLRDTLLQKERELLLSSYTEHRGAKGRVAWALGLTTTELDRLVQSGGLTDEVEDVRERFKREALSPRNLTLRLDLLGRTKYLADLGIKRRFTESLTAELRELLKGSWGAATDLDGMVKHAAKRHGVAPELLARAIERLGLAPELTRHAR